MAAQLQQMVAHPSSFAVVPYCSMTGMLFCRGFKTKPILPLTEAGPAALAPQDRDWDILLTAETHNFPCAVAPYPGMYCLEMAAHHGCIQVYVPMGVVYQGQRMGFKGLSATMKTLAMHQFSTLLAGNLLHLACMTCHISCR